jgi:hypothetical protein
LWGDGGGFKLEHVGVINAAEYDYRTDHGRFGSWYEVYAAAGHRTVVLPSIHPVFVTNPLPTDLSIGKPWGTGVFLAIA